ncbi:MAG: hypothetical protein Q9M27_00215 [Mariprofundaceae bacterium]|nr:hypothetical protein [Mariprofundaceae bacterium]
MEPPCPSFHPENTLEVGLPLIHPEFCKRLYRLSVLFLPGLCVLAGPLWAQVNDTRLRIVIPVEEMQNARSGAGLTNTKLALRLAMPRLWDRIVPRDMRSRADSIAPSYGLVARIVPTGEQTVVEFNGKTVFRTLREHHIPAIVMAPQFHLVLKMRNRAGFEMKQTEALLMQEAKDFSPGWGVELSDNAPSMIVTWQWLNNQQLILSLRGNSRLPEFSETRVMTAADPLPVISDWLKELLLKARDAYAFDVDNAGSLNTTTAEIDQQLILIIDRKTSLMAQVALEDSLSSDPRVRRVLPVSLGLMRQRYMLLLEGTDSSWLPEWFERRGYLLAALPEGGWLAQ